MTRLAMVGLWWIGLLAGGSGCGGPVAGGPEVAPLAIAQRSEDDGSGFGVGSESARRTAIGIAAGSRAVVEPGRGAETRARSAHPDHCVEQSPQGFLMRGSYVAEAGAALAERERKKALHRVAIEYRSRHYGRLPDVGDPSWNAHSPRYFVRRGTFFGNPVSMNERVLVVLGCVEETIRRDCSDDYVVEAVSTWRERSTFDNGEISNHNFGIAIDLDPGKNPCCGCVAAISDRPLCKRPVASVFERTPMPKCWVDRFERFGFYWLGYDQLEDTMHFEFLGDPTRTDPVGRPPQTSSRFPLQPCADSVCIVGNHALVTLPAELDEKVKSASSLAVSDNG